MNRALPSWLTTYGFFALYTGAFALVYFILSNFGLSGFPKFPNIAQFDAGWYKSIVVYGYDYTEGKQNNLGFFPLFPFTWKWTFLSDEWMCLVNAFIYFAGYILLVRTYAIDNKSALFFLSLPSLVFCYLPFAESLFFFFSVVFLMGIEKKNYLLIFIGLFLATLTKSTAMFFIPAAIGMEFLFGKTMAWSKFLRNAACICFPVILAMAIVVFIQYKASGVWFAFAEAQRVGWGHTFKWPVLPYTTYDQARLLWIDGLAFIACIFALAVVLIVGLRKLAKRAEVMYNKAFLFSATFLAMLALYAAFFQVQSNNGTELVSMNRYVFCVPFFIVFFYFLLQHVRLNRAFLLKTSALLLVCFCLLGLFHPMESMKWIGMYGIGANLLYFVLVALLFYGNILSLKTNSTFVFLVFFLFNIAFQAIMLGWFAKGIWIG